MAYYSTETPPRRELTDSSGTGYYSGRFEFVPQAYAGLGKEYPIKTSLPMFSSFTADIPVEQMAEDAFAAAQEKAREALPYVIGGAVVLVGVTVAIVGAFVIGRKTG